MIVEIEIDSRVKLFLGKTAAAAHIKGLDRRTCTLTTHNRATRMAVIEYIMVTKVAFSGSGLLENSREKPCGQKIFGIPSGMPESLKI